MTTAFGLRIRARRNALHLTLDEFARQLTDAGAPITREGVRRWEHGLTSPTVDRVAVIATVLGVTPADLLDGDGDGEVA